MTIEEIFKGAEDGKLTLDQFMSLAKTGNAKFTDLSEGNYVSKQKYDDELSVRDTRINTLNETVTTRDSDLASLQKQLAEAGTDATKLGQLNTDLTKLQGQYDKDTKALQKQLKEQAYSFAVKEYAATKNFSSQAAKRDFIQSLMAKNLQMDGDKILGAEDFATLYSAENADAFVSAKEPETPPTPQTPTPSFVQPSGNPQGAEVGSNNPFAGAFHFAGVRPSTK